VAARQALSLCITQATHMPPAELSAALRGVVAHIDDATALTRQLRMFSYRAAPQAMVLDLPLALQEAWNGMAIGRSGPREPLVLHGVAPPQVRGDAQRLAVLLRILLIEIERLGGAQAPQVMLSMNGSAVRVLFASPSREADASAVGGVGFTLCEEIAREMQGGLWRMEAPQGELRVALELPAER
jgi:C4-dicarboxylate-specific signal transduction histidine kinase